MVWRGDVEKHYENATKAYDVLNLIDNDEITVKNGLRDVIANELILACKDIIDWIGNSKNKNSEDALFYLKELEYDGYDIELVIETRNFIYKLLDKSLFDILNA